MCLLPAALSSQPNVASELSSVSLEAETRATLIEAARDVELHEARFAAERLAPVDIHLWLKRSSADQRARVIDAIQRALRVFTVWYGVVPSTKLIAIDVPWNSPLTGASYPGVIVLSTRWIAPWRDVAVERSIIGAAARQFIVGAAARDPNERWFDEAWALYSGTRAVHEALENGNAATARFFGGHLAHVIRPVQLSLNRADARPRVRHFAEIDEPPTARWRASTAEAGGRAQQGALALHTLERYIGWPAMQQALSTYRARASVNGGSLATFAAVVSEQRGTDLSWFFAEAFRASAIFDFAIDRLATEPAADGTNQYRTTVGLRQEGNAVFAGTSQPVSEFDGGRGLTVSVAFEDGSQADDHWDGREPEKQLEYLSRSPAVSASIDPDAVLLLDRDRSNNTRRLRSTFHPIGARLALHWMVWLQDLMLSCAALA